MIDTNEFLSDELSKMVSKDKFVGWIYSIDYEKALIITNDCWKKRVNGIPHNSFLLASAFDPDNYGQADDSDKEVILLRVTGVCKLPQDNDMISTKIDNYQNQTNIHGQTEKYDIDVSMKKKLQFGGLECRVLGTFYMKDQELYLGSDIESFSTSLRLSVFIPTKDSLEKIVNFVDPIRKKDQKKILRNWELKKMYYHFLLVLYDIHLQIDCIEQVIKIKCHFTYNQQTFWLVEQQF